MCVCSLCVCAVCVCVQFVCVCSLCVCLCGVFDITAPKADLTIDSAILLPSNLLTMSASGMGSTEQLWMSGQQ